MATRSHFVFVCMLFLESLRYNLRTSVCGLVCVVIRTERDKQKVNVTQTQSRSEEQVNSTMLQLDQFYILVSEQAVTYRGDAMTVARHLWKDPMQFHYDCVSAANHRKAHTSEARDYEVSILSHCQINAFGVVWKVHAHFKSSLSESSWAALCVCMQKATMMFIDMLKLSCMQGRPRSIPFISLSLSPPTFSHL